MPVGFELTPRERDICIVNSVILKQLEKVPIPPPTPGCPYQIHDQVHKIRLLSERLLDSLEFADSEPSPTWDDLVKGQLRLILRFAQMAMTIQFPEEMVALVAERSTPGGKSKFAYLEKGGNDENSTS